MRTIILLAIAAPLAAQTNYDPGTAPFANSARFDGANICYCNGPNTHELSWNGYLGQLFWNASNTTTVGVNIFQLGSVAISLYIDGIFSGTIAGNNTVSMTGVTTIATGSWSGSHSFELRWTQSVGASIGPPHASYFLLDAVVTDGTLGAKPPVRPLVTVYGDSLVQGNNTPYPDNTPQLADEWWNLGQALNASVINVGINSQPISTYFLNHVGDMDMPGSWHMFLREGGNDQRLNNTVGSVGTPGTTVGDYVTEMCDLLAISSCADSSILTHPAADILVGLIPPNNLGNGGPGAWNAGIATAVAYVANLAGASRACLVDDTAWTNDTTDVLPDGTHWAYATYQLKVLQRELPLVAGKFAGQSSYTISGPTNGLVNAQQTFTITLAGGAASFSDQSFSLSDDAGASASVTMSGSNTATVTYTPTQAGTRTLTAAWTGNQSCWTNPPSFSFSAYQGMMRSGNSGGGAIIH